MNWSRYKVLLIVGGISLTVAVAGFFWTITSSGTNATLERDISGLESKQNKLTAQTPFPSEASVGLLRKAHGDVAAMRDTLISEIQKGQLTPPKMVRTRFVDYVRALVPELQDAAKTATLGGEEGVILTEPEFGLGGYLQGDLPEGSRLVPLMLELETMSHVCKLLFKSGISELVSFSIVQPKPEDEGNQGGGLLGRRRQGGQTGALAGALTARSDGEDGEDAKPMSMPEKIRAERERLFTTLRFEVRFKVYEDFFWNVLNEFQADSNLFVVESFSLTNGNEKIWPQGLSVAGRGTGGRRAAARPRRNRPERNNDLAALLEADDAEETEEEVDVILPGLKDRRAHFTGGDMLDVTLNVTLYRLKAQSAPAAEVN